MIFLIYAGLTSFAQVDYQNKTLKVTGSAKLLIQPDEIYLIVILTEVNKRDNKMNISQARSEFYKVCNELKVSKENISVSDMRFDAIQQRMNFWKNKVRIFTKQERYEVKFSNLSELERFVKKIEQDYVQNISMGRIAHSKLTDYREEVKMNAIKAAKHKAEYLTKAIEQKVGPAIYIEEITASPFRGLGNSNSSNVNIGGGRRDETLYIIDGMAKNVISDIKPIELRYEILAIFELK